MHLQILINKDIIMRQRKKTLLLLALILVNISPVFAIPVDIQENTAAIDTLTGAVTTKSMEVSTAAGNNTINYQFNENLSGLDLHPCTAVTSSQESVTCNHEKYTLTVKWDSECRIYIASVLQNE